MNGCTSPIYILQTFKFTMLIDIIPYDKLEDIAFKSDDVFSLFTYVNPEGFKEHYMLKVVKFFNLNDIEVKENINEIRSQILDAWNWYKTYMIWEDKRIDSGSNPQRINFN